jgi:capsular exopolysaccharide synthesis family protein
VTLPEYLGLFRKRWLVIVASTLLGLALAATITVLTPHEYSATATLYASARTTSVDSATSAFDLNMLAEERVKSYVPLVTSGTVGQDVANTSNLRTSPGDLAKKVTASTLTGTVLLYITATDTSPDFAARLANAYSDSFVRWTARLEQVPDATHPPVVSIQVATPATAPSTASSPPAVLYWAVGAVLGIAFGVAAALMREALETSVKSCEQLQEAVGVPCLGSLTFDRSSAQCPSIVRDQPRSRRAEEFRQLRARVAFTGAAYPPRVIAMTGALQGEGVTTALCNLAVAIADAGRRVLVIDANLREPAVGRYFDVDQEVGLSSVLTGALPMGRSVQKWRGSNLLDVLSSGSAPENPSELLGSIRMTDLLNDARGRYDVVLIDVPPILRVSDGAALTPHVDGIILAVRYGKTARRFAKAAAGTLGNVSGRLLGGVLTMVPERAARTYTPSFGEYGGGNRHNNEPADRDGVRARTVDPATAGMLTPNGE